MNKAKINMGQEINFFIDYISLNPKGRTIDELIGKHQITTWSNPPVTATATWSRATVFRLLKKLEAIIIREKILKDQKGHPFYRYRINPVAISFVYWKPGKTYTRLGRETSKRTIEEKTFLKKLKGAKNLKGLRL